MVIWLPLRRSRWLNCLRWLQNGCAVLALWHVAWPLPVRLAALLLVIRYARRPTPQPQALLLTPQGLQLFYAGLPQPARLGAYCYCSELLVVLSFQLEHGGRVESLRGGEWARKRWLVLLPDSSDADALRRLRVYLRWHAQISA